MNFEAFRQLVARVAVGPSGSRSLTREQAREGMLAVLDGVVPDVTAAVWLLGLRLKRETRDELLGMLDALRERTAHATAQAADVVELGEPHDGWTRQGHWAPFVCSVLAACGWPAYVVAARGVPPKEGYAHLDVVEVLGGTAATTAREAAERLDGAGWAVVDVAGVSPPLARLVELRRQMVKRTALATLEKGLQPVRGAQQTHWVVGYVHRGYDQQLVEIGVRSGYASALAVRGAEGGVDARLGTVTKWLVRRDGRAEAAAGEAPGVSAAPVAPEPGAVAAAGREALEGAAGPAYPVIVATAATVLAQLTGDSPTEAQARCERAVANGEALARLEAGL